MGGGHNDPLTRLSPLEIASKIKKIKCSSIYTGIQVPEICVRGRGTTWDQATLKLMGFSIIGASLVATLKHFKDVKIFI